MDAASPATRPTPTVRARLARLCLVSLVTLLLAFASLTALPPIEASPATIVEPATWTPGAIVTYQATATLCSRIYLPLITLH